MDPVEILRERYESLQRIVDHNRAEAERHAKLAGSWNEMADAGERECVALLRAVEILENMA